MDELGFTKKNSDERKVRIANLKLQLVDEIAKKKIKDDLRVKNAAIKKAKEQEQAK